LPTTFQFLHSPASASAVTYSVRFAHGSAATRTIYLNRDSGDTDSIRSSRATSTITAMEVPA
jgi:hypothetical protein